TALSGRRSRPRWPGGAPPDACPAGDRLPSLRAPLMLDRRQRKMMRSPTRPGDRLMRLTAALPLLLIACGPTTNAPRGGGGGGVDMPDLALPGGPWDFAWTSSGGNGDGPEQLPSPD